MNPPKSSGGPMQLSEVELESMLARAAEQGAKRALADVGLEGKDAALDIRDLRSLLDCLRFVRRTAVQTVVDTFTRYVPVLDPRFSYRAEDVVRAMEQVCPTIGYPKTIRVDQGSEFISRDLDLWAYAKEVTLDFSRPGKPTDNAHIEAFNGRFRAECLNAHWFMTLADAAEKMEEWRKDYNTVRPHSAIGNKPPISLMKGSPAVAPP